jgi:hypothetical protein
MKGNALDIVLVQFRHAVSHWEAAYDHIIGLKVRIISDYNGLPYGKFEPSLKGQERIVEGLHFDLHSLSGTQSGVSLKLEGQRLYIRLEEVELVWE